MNGFADFLKTLGAARIVALGLVTVALLGFFAYVGARVTKPQMSLLYAEMNVDDAAAIVSELDTLNIPYELRGDGTTIMVPSDSALRLRMSMAEKGLPAGGSVGYEIFDNADALGTTSFVQNLNHLRALEGELARTIRALDRIQAARVHLVLPEREIFSREKREPSASIILKVRGQALNRAQVKSIQYLVSSAVDGLTPGNVSIVDDKGSLLASGTDDNSDTALVASLEERNAAYERKLRTQLEEIVQRIVGSDKARVEVAAEMDFSRVTQTSDLFDPDGQVVRSTQTVEENSSNVDEQNNDAVTVGDNLPGGGLDDQADALTRESSNRVEETVNYEISRTTKTEVMEAGRVKRLSVAVLVDGAYATAEDGTVTYTPRPQTELDQIGALVRSAIGYDETRGDQVEIINLRFAAAPEAEPLAEVEEPFLGLTKADYMRIGELALLAILSILILLMVVRPIVMRALGATVPAAAGGVPALSGSGAQPQLESAGMPALAPPGAQAEEPDELMIDIAKVEGKVKESSVRKIGELVSGHPDESLSILRSWLYESA